jgi:hypothetical protein
MVNLDGLRRAAGIDGQRGSSDVFRIVPEQEFDGVRNVFDTRQSLQGAASHNLPRFASADYRRGVSLKGFVSMNRRISNAQS